MRKYLQLIFESLFTIFAVSTFASLAVFLFTLTLYATRGDGVEATVLFASTFTVRFALPMFIGLATIFQTAFIRELSHIWSGIFTAIAALLVFHGLLAYYANLSSNGITLSALHKLVFTVGVAVSWHRIRFRDLPKESNPQLTNPEAKKSRDSRKESN